MQKYFRSIALIPNEDRSAWFCTWSESDNYFDFISVEPNAGDSFRECIANEVIRILELRSRDVLVANMAQINDEYVGVLPDHPDQQHIAVAFFMVHLYSKSSKHVVDSLPDGRWLASDELLEGKAQDGLSMSPTLIHLLRRTEVIQAW
jgi:hypothetical protein